MSRLQSKASQRGGAQDVVSPFKLPNDEEVFIFRESEKQKKQEIKKRNKNMRIWDKKTAFCRNPKRLFRNYINEDELREEIETLQPKKFNSKDKKLIQDAIEIVRSRQKNKETLKTKKGLAPKKKEGIVELIEQKKEMFLVEKTCNIIKEEIMNLDRKRDARRKALESSIKLMQEDDHGFEKFKRKNTQDTQNAIWKADDQFEKRKDLDILIKKLKSNQNQVSSENQRIEESAQNFKIYKEFLDSITNEKDHRFTQWKQKKEKLKNDKIGDSLEQFIAEQKAQSNLNQSQQGRRGRQGQSHQKRNRENMEREFFDLLDQGKIQDVENFENDYPMYFSDPKQLIEIFEKLEEDNLEAINQTQELNNKKDANERQFKAEQKQLEAEHKALQEDVRLIKQQIKNEQYLIHALQKKNSQHFQLTQNDNKDPLRNAIIKMYQQFDTNMGNKIEITKETKTIDILSRVEEFLEKILQHLNYDYKLPQIQEQKLIQKKEQKTLNIKKSKEQQQKLIEKRQKLQQNKAHKPIERRHGRIDMYRTKPLQIKKVEVKTTILDEEAMQKLKFMRGGYGAFELHTQ